MIVRINEKGVCIKKQFNKIATIVITLMLLLTLLPATTVLAAFYDANTVVSLANQHVGSGWPNGYCLGYVATMFNQAYGFDGNVHSSCCAYQNGNKFIDSTSRSNIPLGACVYFGGSDVVCGCGNRAGHIAIYVGNNNVVHSWAGSIVCTSIDYVINCGYPYRGYGWYANAELSTDSIPVGSFDTAVGGNNSLTVTGWAYDPDTPSTSLNIHIYMDGQKIGETVANTKRTDVHQSHGCGENHGFEVTLPVTVTSTAKHTIKVYAINTNSSAGNKDLGSKEVTITAHTHSYTKKVTKAATCTQTGVETYTCSCNDKYTKTIPATGHSYATVHIPVSGTTPAKTKYTCNTCGDTYTKYAESAYSAWSTTKPVDVVDALIETKTQYRYKDKQTTTSTSSAKSGWILYDQTTQWGEYGAWSGWSDTAVSSTDARKVEQRTVWPYYYLLCPNCGAHMHGYGTCYTWAGGCGSPTYNTGWHEIWSPTSWDSANLQDWHGTGKHYTTINGELVFKWSDASATTQYRYCTRELQNIYKFYRWTAWSNWSSQKVTASDNRQVETRTLYRYVQTKRIGTNGTELILQGNDWYYYKDGKIDTSNTLAKFDGKWYHLNGGKWVKDTGLVKYNDVWCYVKNGILNTSEDTLIKFSGKWYHVKDGRWQQGETKLYKYNGKWCYLKNGVLNTADTLVKISGKWYHVKGGTWQQGENGFYKYGGEWCYLQNGILKTNDTLVKVDGKWYHINRGRWVRDTTKVYHGGKWHQVVNGIKV